MNRRTRTSHGWVDLLARCFVGVSMGWVAGGIAGVLLVVVTVDLGWVAMDEFGITGFVGGALGALAGAALGFAWFAADFPVPRWLPRRRRSPAAGPTGEGSDHRGSDSVRRDG